MYQETKVQKYFELHTEKTYTPFRLGHDECSAHA